MTRRHSRPRAVLTTSGSANEPATGRPPQLVGPTPVTGLPRRSALSIRPCAALGPDESHNRCPGQRPCGYGFRLRIRLRAKGWPRGPCTMVRPQPDRNVVVGVNLLADSPGVTVTSFGGAALRSERHEDLRGAQSAEAYVSQAARVVTQMIANIGPQSRLFGHSHARVHPLCSIDPARDSS